MYMVDQGLDNISIGFGTFNRVMNMLSRVLFIAIQGQCIQVQTLYIQRKSSTTTSLYLKVGLMWRKKVILINFKKKLASSIQTLVISHEIQIGTTAKHLIIKIYIFFKGDMVCGNNFLFGWTDTCHTDFVNRS